jgi:hypothetical protein
VTGKNEESVLVKGWGVVSPAGWGIEAFREALAKGKALGTQEMPRPGWPRPFKARRVPAPVQRPEVLVKPRLRRASAISQYAAAAAFEALGTDRLEVINGNVRLGIVLCVMAGCVNYTRRFYEETLRDPFTASPLLFPETVFNAPASHVAAVFQTSALNYTLVGDGGMFLQGLALAAGWLMEEEIDACLVIGSEEADWLSGDSFWRFARPVVLGEGAGALYLRKSPRLDHGKVSLMAVTDPWSYGPDMDRFRAADLAAKQLPPPLGRALLCDGLQTHSKFDAPEEKAWSAWTGARLSVKKILGDGLAAGSAWQCVAAVDAIRPGEFDSAVVSVAGANQQALAAQFGSVFQ